MDPLQKISVHYSNLTKTEKNTCNIVIKNPQIIIDHPIAEAAQLYDVSPSSILRVAQKIGYKGYSEFRYALENYYQNPPEAPENRKLYQRVVQNYQASWTEMANHINEEKILSLVELLANKRIISIGVGNSSLPAQQLIYSMYMLNKLGDFITDNIRLGFLDKAVTEDYVLIVFSVSGNVDIYQEEIKKWKQSNVPIVLITTNPETPLLSDVDLSFVLPPLGLTILADNGQTQNLENRSNFFIFIDIVIAYYLVYQEQDS